MTGKEMCGLSKEEFCTRAPVFVGDILWEHLVLLQQDVDREKAALKNAPSNLSETSTDPVTSASPQKTYHTLSTSLSPRHYQTYTSLESRTSPPLSIKSEYPAPVTSYPQYHHQYQYQRPAQQYQYQHYYDTPAPVSTAGQYPASVLQSSGHSAVFPVSAPAAVMAGHHQPAGRWSTQSSAGLSYQVQIISHYNNPDPPLATKNNPILQFHSCFHTIHHQSSPPADTNQNNPAELYFSM